MTQAMPLHMFIGFNSRPCVRGDTRRRQLQIIRRSFNSRPCVRGDICYTYLCDRNREFQFTPLREGRRPLWFSDV